MSKAKKIQSNEDGSLDALYAKRDEAIERFIAAWEKQEVVGDDPEDEVNTALDGLSIAHIAASLGHWGS